MFSKLSNFLSTPVFEYFDWKNIKVVGYFSIFVNLTLLVVPLYTLQVYDRVFASRNPDTLLYMTIGVIFFVILSYGVNAIKSYLLIRIGNGLDKKLSPVVLKRVLQNSTVDANVQSLKDVEKVKNFAAGPQGMALFFDLPWVLFFLFIVYFIHPILATVMAVNMLILFSLTVATDYFTSIHYNNASEISTKSLLSASESVRNRSLINALGMRGNMIQRWLETHFQGVNALTFASDYAVKFSESAKMMRMLQNILMTGIGAYLAINNVITIGGMITASILAGKAAGPIEGLISSWKNLLSSREAIKKLNILLTSSEDKVVTKLPKPQGDLSIENLSFVEPKNELEILKNLSFAIKSGEIVGIVGPSSSGKTTLARLLVGILEPTSGSLRIDNATLDQWSDDDRGEFMGYMPQEITLLSGTIKENISRFQECSDELIIEAAMLAGVHETILRLPHGYDTMISNAAENLSGGQRQRVALARAFFKMPSVVVLDEPNSFLDAEGEIALVNAMNKMRENGSTVVVITHKPSIISRADKLMVLNGGKIVSFGNYADVIKKIT